MKRGLVAVGLAIFVTVFVYQQRRVTGRLAEMDKPPIGKTDRENRILGVLRGMQASGDVYLEVPDADGRMLRVLAETAGARHIVEIGTSTGYSTLWLCLALDPVEGRLTTYELDGERAERARQNFSEAGVDRQVTLVEGDAHERLTELKGPVDVAFLDAEKSGYVDYLNKLLPHVRAGGLILAHNIEVAPDYVRAVTGNPDLETVFYMQGNGLGVTLKKR